MTIIFTTATRSTFYAAAGCTFGTAAITIMKTAQQATIATGATTVATMAGYNLAVGTHEGNTYYSTKQSKTRQYDTVHLNIPPISYVYKSKH